MIRLSKLTDYGFVILSWMAGQAPSAVFNARDLSDATGIPLPTVGKLLKTLSKSDILSSHRGAKGGYSLARKPESIHMVEIITVFEGPIALMECATQSPNACDLEPKCQVKPHWQKLTLALREALLNVRLIDLVEQRKPPASARARGAGASTGDGGVAPSGNATAAPTRDGNRWTTS